MRALANLRHPKRACEACLPSRSTSEAWGSYDLHGNLTMQKRLLDLRSKKLFLLTVGITIFSIMAII